MLEDVSALVQALGKNPVVCGDKAGFIANTLLFGYLNHAVSMYENALRLPRGHRRGDALRLRLPDGSAGPARPDRPRHGVRDPRDDVPPGPRPPARARADPQADGHRRACSAARPAGASTPTRRPTARSSCDDDKTPSADDKPAAQARPQARRRRRHRHDGDRHRRGLRQGRVRRHLRRPLAGQGRRRAYDDRALARQGDPARQARRGGQGGRARPAHRLDLARRPRPGRPRRRGDRRGPQDQDHPVREPRRDLQAGRDPRDHDVVAADHPVRPGHQPARRTSSGCTSSTRRRS